MSVVVEGCAARALLAERCMVPSKGGLNVSLFSAHPGSNLGVASTLFLICTKMSDRSVGKAGERGLEKRLSARPALWQSNTSSLLGICIH